MTRIATTSSFSYDALLDVTGMICPMPILKAKKQLTSMQPGQILKIIASDPMVEADFPEFCRVTGYELLSLDVTTSPAKHYHLRIRR